MMKQSAADAIKRIRGRTGLSQKKFAERYEIPRRTVEGWEAGNRVPPEYLVKLLERVVEEDFRA